MKSSSTSWLDRARSGETRPRTIHQEGIREGYLAGAWRVSFATLGASALRCIGFKESGWIGDDNTSLTMVRKQASGLTMYLTSPSGSGGAYEVRASWAHVSDDDLNARTTHVTVTTDMWLDIMREQDNMTLCRKYGMIRSTLG